MVVLMSRVGYKVRTARLGRFGQIKHGDSPCGNGKKGRRQVSEIRRWA